MAKVQIHFFIDVEVTAEDNYSWEALNEGYKIVKDILSEDKRIGNIYHEGISGGC